MGAGVHHYGQAPKEQESNYLMMEVSLVRESQSQAEYGIEEISKGVSLPRSSIVLYYRMQLPVLHVSMSHNRGAG